MTADQTPDQPGPVTRAIKGFNADMTCRGFQFAEGETYEHEGRVVPCHSGFHAVTEPIDVFGYYPPATSVYHEVEMQDVQTHGDDSKIASRVVRIGAKIELPALIKAQVDLTFARANKPTGDGIATGDRGAASSTGDRGAASSTGDRGAASSTGYQGAASSTGDRGAASSTGDRGAASSTGDQGAASSTGDQGAASSTGDRGAASSTGDQGAASSTGYQGAASSTGYQGAASSTGDRGAASSTGDRGAASSTGYQGAASSTGYQGAALAVGTEGSASAMGAESVAIATGYLGRAKGSAGSWLVLTERDDERHILGMVAVQVDGKKIAADTYYTLRGGQVVTS